jgi:hypothetical protein
MNDKPYIPLSSSEIGTLWMTYQEKTMIIQMLHHFIACSEDREVLTLLSEYQSEELSYTEQIMSIFVQEGAVVPNGFGEQDVKKDAPALYNGLFEVSAFRLLMKISMGLYALHMSMSYRDDIRKLNEAMTAAAQRGYNRATELLLRRGLLARPPIVTPPVDVKFVQSLEYMSGQGILNKARPINTIEIAHIYQQYETNTTGFELMTGFAQTASEEDVRNYFRKGKELAQDTVDMLGALLKESDLHAFAQSSGRTTLSNTPVFSDKLMMYCANLLTSFGLGGNAIGTSFSLRSDLPIKFAAVSTKAYQFAQEGGKIMIKHKWMEEPPQAENRDQLIAVK